MYHTLQLVRAEASVKSFDIRSVNVLRTYARGLAFGYQFDVQLGDAETMHKDFQGDWAVIFHCGILYHLKDPITHLKNISNMAKYLMLDTHVGRPDETILAGNKRYQGHYHDEHGWNDPLSGKGPISFMLTEESILRLAEDMDLKLIEKSHAWSPDRMFFLFKKKRRSFLSR